MNPRCARSSQTAQKPLVATALVAITCLLLSGCARSTTSSDSSEVSVGQNYDYGSSTSEASNSDFDSSYDSDDSNSESQGTTVEAHVIVTGHLLLDVADPGEALAQASTIVTEAGGSVAHSSLQEESDSPWGNATFKIPANSFEETRQKLAELGKVTDQSTDTADVGAEVADLDARITVLEASIARLTTLIDQAETTSDLLEAERELTNRQEELDSLNAQRAWYSDQVSYSTLEVSFHSTAITPVPSSSAWEESWQAFSRGIAGLVYGLIMFVPWLIVIIPITLFFVWLHRRRVVRRRARAEAPSTMSTETEPEAQVDPVAQATNTLVARNK